MKNLKYYFTLLIFAVAFYSQAQNIGINDDGSSPNGSAILDVKSTDKGILIPRVQLDDINTAAPIISPAEGLLIYNETGTEPKGFYYWNDTVWVKLQNQLTAGDGNTISNDTINVTPSTGSGKVINVTYRVNSTRTATSTPVASVTLESFTVDKLSPTSILVIQGSISARGNYSGFMQQGWRLGAGTEVIGQTLTYVDGSNNWARVISTSVVIAGHTTTGSQNLVFRYFAANGNTSNYPFTIYNPNSSDDPRLSQTSSVYVVYEIEP